MAPATDKVPPRPPLGSCWGANSISAAAPVHLQGWGVTLGLSQGGQGMEVTAETQGDEQGRQSRSKAISLLCEPVR